MTTVTMANAALSAKTANTIQGTKPYLSTTLTTAIQLGNDFELFGISDGTNSYYTQSDIDTHLFESLNYVASINKPSDLTSMFSPSLAAPSLILPNIQAEDSDGDIIDSLTEKMSGGVKLGWYRLGTNTQLTAVELGQTFCKLAGSGITPELRISGAITLKTLYGAPLSQDYPDVVIGITQTPKRVFDYSKIFESTANHVCYAKPDMAYSRWNYAGPATMWDGGTIYGQGTPSDGNGFIPQSTIPALYGSNFPTTGANNLYFDLIMAAVDASQLNWTTVTEGGITVTPSVINSHTVKITLTGPKATAPASSPTNPYADGATALKPTLPSTFVIEGKQGGITKASYGFVLKQWYVNRGDKHSPVVNGNTVNSDGTSYINQSTWCGGLNGSSYRLSKVNDLTNASGGTWIGALPDSGGNYFKRYIGSGLFSEWSRMSSYSGAGFVSSGYWTADSESIGISQFSADSNFGRVGGYPQSTGSYGLCTTP